jgi:hypothetical protein
MRIARGANEGELRSIAAAARPGGGARLELALGGRRLRIARGVNAGALRSLLTLVEVAGKP